MYTHHIVTVIFNLNLGCVDKTKYHIGNFSIRFWRQYVPLFASIAAVFGPIVDFRQKKVPCLIIKTLHKSLGQLKYP